MFLINGHAQDQLAVSDRATQFGDGSFTTARIVDGNICHLEAHLQRLQVACENYGSLLAIGRPFGKR